MFDQPNNFPQILFHAWECLTAYGPMEQDRLRSLLAPSSFAETAHESVRDTISLGIKIHVFTKEAGLISNCDRTKECVDYNDFRRTVRDICFDQKDNNSAETKDGKGKLQSAASWYFSFPVEEAPGAWEEARLAQIKDFGNEPTLWPIKNPTQWNNFERWMRFFGLGDLVISKLRLNTREMILRPAISEVLEDLVRELQEPLRIPLGSFLDFFIQRLPCFPGGIVSNQLSPELVNRNRRNNALVAQTLIHLKDKGILKLEVGADFKDREVFSPDSNGFTFDFVLKGK